MNIEEQKKLLAIKRTTRSQLRDREGSWEGRLWESHQAMNKKSIRGRQGGMSWHNTAKSLHLTALEVNGTLGWCGGRELESPAYPIRHFIDVRLLAFL